MSRILQVLAAACLLTAVLVVPASGQESGLPGPLDVLLDAFDSPEGEEFTARFIKQPTTDVASVEDPVGDFVHSTGEDPGFTPDHLDITSIWALELNPGPIDLFTPTDANHIWAPRGRLEVDPPNYDPFHTFTGEQIHDGSQYENGAFLFGFTLVETPPAEPPGRCEYVVWVNDLQRGDTFVNNPNFPLDPATGTNVAFGLALNPIDGPGIQSGFSVELQVEGGFAPFFEADIRAFITPGYVGITVPRDLIGELGSANFYTFCAEEDNSFEAGVSGADQTDLIEMTAQDLGIVQFEAQDLPSEPTTTTTVATTTTQPRPETTTSIAAEAEAEIDGEDDEGFPWWLPAIAGGIGLVLVGWWLHKREDDPCRELFETWKRAEHDCEDAKRAADEAAEACDAADLELERLEGEREDLCKTWPPVCWDTEEGDWIEDDRGNRITSRDIHMRKVALGDVWADYRAGKLSATEVEERWRQIDTPDFREEIRQTDELFKEILEGIDADLADARQYAEEACGGAADAQAAAGTACSNAAEARSAYEECVGRAVAPSSGEKGAEPTNGTARKLSPTAGATSSGLAGDSCEGQEGKREARPGGEADRIRIFVDFSVTTGALEGSERELATGERLALHLNDLAIELAFAGDLLNARSAGLHIGGAVNGYTPGKYTVTGSGVIKGGVDATVATTSLAPDVPTTLLQADVESLEVLTRLGEIIAGKVTDWTADVQVTTVRLRMLYQDITATPYEIWECKPGQGWVCIERVWEIDVSRLKEVLGKDREYTVDSDLRRRQFQRIVRGTSQRAASAIKRDAENLPRWRAEHEPGPCR